MCRVGQEGGSLRPIRRTVVLSCERGSAFSSAGLGQWTDRQTTRYGQKDSEAAEDGRLVVRESVLCRLLVLSRH